MNVSSGLGAGSPNYMWIQAWNDGLLVEEFDVDVVQGTLIGLIGTLLGLASGILVASNIEIIIPALEQFFQTQFLPRGVYPITDLPSEMKQSDIIKITLLSFIVSVLATLYPALRAARTRPAEALSYE